MVRPTPQATNVVWRDAHIAICVRLHYIPLSMSYQEIYNIHSFFSGATRSTLLAANSTTLQSPARRRPVDGDRRLRRIARAGKQWKRVLGRRVDMEGEFLANDSVMTLSDSLCRSVRLQACFGVRQTVVG